MAEQEYAMLILQGISEDMLVASAKAYANEKSDRSAIFELSRHMVEKEYLHRL